jgi:hypothetical protein
VADIANAIWVGAAAAKAAEAMAVTIARTRKAFAQILPIKEYTEEEGELWDVGVIGSLFGSLLTARNFSTHGNLGQRGEPIARKLHRSNSSIGPYHAVNMSGSEEMELETAIDTTLVGKAYSFS